MAVAELDTTPPPRASPPEWSRRAQRAAAMVILGFSALVLLVSQAGRMTADPGQSHDGQNLGVFALGSEALREEGPIDSHLGAELAYTSDRYANHPPLIYSAIAASESVFGTKPWSTRLPTVIGAFAVIPLLYLVLRRAGIAELPAAAGVAIAVGNPFFSMYGWMPDTPMLTFPLALTTWLMFDRARRTGDTGWLAVAAVACCLSGWQGALLCGVTIGYGWVATSGSEVTHEARANGRSAVKVLIASAAIGVATVLTWITWTHGSLSPLFDQAGRRAGVGETFTISTAARAQLDYMLSSWRLPVLVAAPIGVVLAFRNRAARGTALVWTTVVVLYGAVFWQASAYHTYWNLWVVAPAALGIAMVCAHLLDASRTPAARYGVVAAAILMPLMSAAVGAPAEKEFDTGLESVPAVMAPLADGQTATYEVGFGTPIGWMSYLTQRPTVALDLPHLEALAEEHPEYRVTVMCAARAPGRTTSPCDELDDPTKVGNAAAVQGRADAVATALGVGPGA